jgi:hypothetical protein
MWIQSLLRVAAISSPEPCIDLASGRLETCPSPVLHEINFIVPLVDSDFRSSLFFIRLAVGACLCFHGGFLGRAWEVLDEMRVRLQEL